MFWRWLGRLSRTDPAAFQVLTAQLLYGLARQDPAAAGLSDCFARLWEDWMAGRGLTASRLREALRTAGPLPEQCPPARLPWRPRASGTTAFRPR